MMMNEKTTWRLIVDPAAPGAWNMAVDEAILQSVGRFDAPSTLRLYAWNPACLSLGYGQNISDVDLVKLDTLGWNIVRRPTGGQAILHVDELTYAVIGPVNDPILRGDVLESYKRLSVALLDALNILGVSAMAFPKTDVALKLNNKAPICFEVPSDYEITVQGKKIIGSAQARKYNGILQHGSFPLTGDLSRITKVLCYPGDDERQVAADRVLQRATTSRNVLGREISWGQAASAFVKAFHETLNIQLLAGEMTPGERECARKLELEKYGNLSWTRAKETHLQG